MFIKIISIVVLLVVLFIIFFLVRKMIKDGKNFDNTVIICELVTAAILAITLFVQTISSTQITNLTKKSQDSNIAIVLREFTQPELTRCREIVGGLRDRLREDTLNVTGVRDSIKAYFLMELTDVTTILSIDTAGQTPVYKGYKESIRLIRYFEGLYCHVVSEESARMCFFYYAWWRNYLMDFIMIYDEARDEFEAMLKSGKVGMFRDYPLLETTHVWAAYDKRHRVKKMDLVTRFDARLRNHKHHIDYYPGGKRRSSKRKWRC